MEDVVKFPAKLEQLAERIKDDLARREASKAAWVEATVDLCVALVEARDAFKDDQSFGKWCEAQGFDLNKDDRAAAIAMGRDIEQARQVLATTQSRSLQLICRNEFRFLSDKKPTIRQQKQRTTAKRRANVQKAAKMKAEPKPYKPGPATQAALDAMDQLKAAGEEITENTVQQKAGVSASTVNKAFNIRKAEAEAAAAPVPDYGLGASQQQKLEAAITAHKKRLDREFDQRVQEAAHKIVNDLRIPIYEKKLAELEKMLTSPRFSVMTKAEYNAILRCMHSDSANTRTKEQLDEAFQIFTKYKLKMISDAEERERERDKLLSDLPKTSAGFMRVKRPPRGAAAKGKTAKTAEQPAQPPPTDGGA